MRAALGPLDAGLRVPALQQTRIASFLISAHGAEARVLAGALMNPIAGQRFGAREIEVHAQFCREMEIVSLLTRATSWQPDPALALLAWRWELAWLPRPVPGLGEGGAQAGQGLAIDAAAFGFALHTAIRPAIVLPENAAATDPFAIAMKRIEVESSRVVQAQLRFLKSPELAPARETIAAAVEHRHQQLRQLWADLLAGLGVEQGS